MSFTFKQFHIDDAHCAMKISTDGVLLGAWIDVDDVRRVLDVGTGSGLIALMMAQRFENATIAAVEIMEDAVSDAYENVANSPWSNRINIHCCDFMDYHDDKPYDLIVSNPPFFDTAVKSLDMARASARHANKSLSYCSLIERATAMLAPRGSLAMVLPAEYEDDMIFRAELAKLYIRRICRVVSVTGKKPLRLLCQLSPTPGNSESSTLIIRDTLGNFTEDYRRLTQSFYLKF